MRAGPQPLAAPSPSPPWPGPDTTAGPLLPSLAPGTSCLFVLRACKGATLSPHESRSCSGPCLTARIPALAQWFQKSPSWGPCDWTSFSEQSQRNAVFAHWPEGTARVHLTDGSPRETEGFMRNFMRIARRVINPDTRVCVRRAEVPRDCGRDP